MADSAWDYCVPAVDYDALRKDISSSFEDKVVEIQSLVVKLQKTQRAAEQVLDRRTSHRRRDMLHDMACPVHGTLCQGMRKCVRRNRVHDLLALVKAQVPG